MLIEPVARALKKHLGDKYGNNSPLTKGDQGGCEPSALFSFPPKDIDADYASNLPLIISKKTGTEINVVFLELKEIILATELVVSCELSRGFINLSFKKEYIYKNLIKLWKSPSEIITPLKPEKWLIEFVSANPTGPLHIGHGRGAVIGNALSNLLSALGIEVVREYYINDQGNQVELLKKSVEEAVRKIKGESYSENPDFYKGGYVEELAGEVMDKNIPDLKKYLIQALISNIKSDLIALGIKFDEWKSEAGLYESGLPDRVLSILKDKGLMKESEGAKCLAAEDLADDKDRVLVKKDGQPTYFLSDIAYHVEKDSRGFDREVNIWGADHHGYVKRLKGAMKQVIPDQDKLEVILFQMVNLIRDGKRIQMSKRSGGYVTLKSLLDEVGRDCITYFFLSKSPDSQIDFDVELAKKQSSENPVFYTQYCYARICSLLGELAKKNIDLPIPLLAKRGVPLNSERDGVFPDEPGGGPGSPPDLSLMTGEEYKVVRHLLRYPDILNSAKKCLSAHVLVEYVYRLSEIFHRYYNANRIITEDEAMTNVRIFLCVCVRNVLGNAFDILGITRREKM